MSSKKDGGGKEKEVEALFTELNKMRQTEDYDKAIKVCNKILNVTPNDPLAFHCKIVSMVHCGKFDDALKQMENDKFQLDLTFERAYCYYRLNNPLKALEIVDSVKMPKVKHQELRAQILYRLENYDECFSVYRNMLKSTTDDYELERMTNLSAVTANMEDKTKMAVDKQDTYELRYNAGCNYAAAEDYKQAEVALKAAEETAKAFLAEDGSTEEEIEEETGIIRVQLGYTFQKLGREKEAQAIYNQVLRNKPSDIGLVAVASNNLLTLNKDQNIFDSKKRIKAATVEGLEHKLTGKQRRGIARNNALLAMYTAQVDLCQQLLDELDPSTIPDKRLIMAAALARAGKHQEAVDGLLGGGSSDPILQMTAANIYLAAGEVAAGAEMLARLPEEWKFRTGVLSTLVTLQLALENREAAAQVLKSAVVWSKKKGSVQGDADMATVFRKTAEFHLNSGEPGVAAQSLEELLQIETDNMTTLAQLVLAYAKFDLDKALAASKRLPLFEHGSVDVDALEKSGAMGAKHKNKQTPKPGSVPSPKTDHDGDVIKKKKKKRKLRLPKGATFNPNADPDPERWLPRHERTGLRYNMPGGYRKPRKDKRKAEKFTGAQGVDSGKAETYDYSAKVAADKAAAANKTESTPPAPEPKVGPRKQSGKPQNKSKKKGGKNKF